MIRPGSLVLVRDGRVVRGNMRRELITNEELHTLLREQGVVDLDQVREVRMEADGRFSVTTRTPGRLRNDRDERGGLG